MPHIQVFSEVPARDGELDALRLRLAEVEFPAPFALVLTDTRLELRKLENQRAWIEKWDGQLPTTVLGDAVPMVTLK